MMADPGRVLLFWDYDTQWGGDRSRSGQKKTWGMADFVNTERLLELHARFDLPATFACVGAAALPGERPYHDPAQIRRMSEAGHEVASHSMRHDWLPGLHGGALYETLRASRAALEDCIGSPVTTFVPPWNQPYDYLAVGSISLSERREARENGRTDAPRLCAALAETGYRFARLAYRNGVRRVLEKVMAKELPRPAVIKRLRGISYVLLNTPAGFAAPTRAVIEEAAVRGGIAVVWGHPHSLTAENDQNERHLVPLLERLSALRKEGRIAVAQPRGLTKS